MNSIAKKRAPRTKDSSPKPKRNHKEESSKALAGRVERVAVLREHRDSGILGDDLMQVAQSLILIGLPYAPTKETKISRTARLADGSTVSVTFTAGLKNSAMPYGSDRSLLHYLLDRAVKTGSRFISWKNATQYLEHMGMNPRSGKNHADLRQRFERLRGLTIGVDRSKDGASASQLMPFLRRTSLPSKMDIKNDQNGQPPLPLSEDDPFGVEIDEMFFHDLIAWHVPVPSRLIVQTRKQSQLQDLCLWLQWRCYAARSESEIPWNLLAEQMWQSDATERRIKVRFSEAIKFLRALWPELQAEVRPDCLWVAPPKGKSYLLPQGKDARRLG